MAMRSEVVPAFQTTMGDQHLVQQLMILCSHGGSPARQGEWPEHLSC
ncbi:hypothetical protein [Pseudomonas sp. LB3P25]